MDNIKLYITHKLLGKYCYIYYADANLFWTRSLYPSYCFFHHTTLGYHLMSSPSSWNRIKAVMHRPGFCLVRLYVSGTFIFLPEIPFVSEMVNNMYSKWCKHIGVFGFCFILFAELLFIYGQRFCASTVEQFCITWRNIKSIFMRCILKMHSVVFRLAEKCYNWI